MRIPFTTTQVAGLSVGMIDASATSAPAAGGSDYRFIGMVASQKGEPFKVHAVNDKNIGSLLGEALHPSKGYAALSLRYVREALQGGVGYVVPVVGANAVKPVIALKAGATAISPNVAAARTAAFGVDVALNDTELCAIYPVDGDVSARKLSITPVASKTGYFNVKLVKSFESGGEVEQINREVSFNPLAVDEFGGSAFIADVLSSTNILNITIKQNTPVSSFVSLAEVAFAGGTRGDLNAIEPAQYDKAIQVIDNTITQFQAILPFGIVDPAIIKKLQKVALDHRVDAFFDVPSHLSHSAALAWMTTNNFESKESCFYHFPYLSNDSYFATSKALLGLSSFAYASKAKSVESVKGVGGYHLSPAGKKRAVINRSGIESLPNLGEVDYEEMYKKRINKVVADPETGRLLIDDAITATIQENYLRFQHVVSTFHAISRRFYSQSQELKHDPDGVTLKGLNQIMKRIAVDFTSAGALVAPRNKEDGSEPFTWKVEQVEFDLWHVTWYACPTGTARRIAGFPVAVR